MEQMSLMELPAVDTAVQPGGGRRRPKSDWRDDVVPLQPQLPMVCEGFESLFDWTEEEITVARCALLADSVAKLSDNRTCQETRDEIWDWIEDEAIHLFSFKVCVRELAAHLGVAVDVETVRDGIRWHVRRMQRQCEADCVDGAAEVLVRLMLG